MASAQVGDSSDRSNDTPETPRDLCGVSALRERIIVVLYLDRIEPWLERLLVDRPARQTAVIRAYALWFVLYRARRNNPAGRSSAPTGGAIRARIRAALLLLRPSAAGEHRPRGTHPALARRLVA